MAYNQLMRTKENVFLFLAEQKILIHAKATEAADLGNQEGSEDLLQIYSLMDEISRRLAHELK